MVDPPTASMNVRNGANPSDSSEDAWRLLCIKYDDERMGSLVRDVAVRQDQSLQVSNDEQVMVNQQSYHWSIQSKDSTSMLKPPF